MIYTLLLEPYTFPRLVPVTVTILPGLRRLRFSRNLRARYIDFSPRLWLFLQKLGYKKYMQRIYVDLEVNRPVASPWYELPILLAVLQELKLITFSSDICVSGKILPNYGILASSLYSQTMLQHFTPVSPTKLVTILEKDTVFTLLNKLVQGTRL